MYFFGTFFKIFLGVGTIRTNEGLQEVVSLETDKLRFVSGSEDFMCRVYAPLSTKSGGNTSASSSSNEENDGDGEGSNLDDDGDVAMGGGGGGSGKSNKAAASAAQPMAHTMTTSFAVGKSTDGFDEWLSKNGTEPAKKGKK